MSNLNPNIDQRILTKVFIFVALCIAIGGWFLFLSASDYQENRIIAPAECLNLPNGSIEQEKCMKEAIEKQR